MIHSSVFTPVTGSVDGVQPMTPAPALTPDHGEPMTSERFVGIVDSVKEAIRSGIQPLRIAQGSSGSYFCRNADGKIVGVFKPKNEEPYGQLNPKWAKWIHRNLFPCCFGRSCLIPNLGYISESATSLVDRRLKLNIVPSTEVVWLSSPAFHYDYLDRRAAQLHKGAKPLPDKVGSFQLFLNGFKDANLFMRDHPWPVEQPTIPASANGGATTGGEGSHGKGRHSSIWRRTSRDSLRSFQQDADGSSVHGSHMGSTHGGLSGDRHGFTWTPALQQQFREQFEKMIILDYLIRNTDRGLDNWMIRYCEKEGISIVAGPPSGTQKGNLQNQQQQQHQASRRGSRVGDLLGLTSDRGSPRSSSSSMREGAERNSMLATPPGTPPRSNLSRVVSGKEFLQDGEESNSMAQQRKRSGSLTEQSSSEAERIAGSSSAARDMNANTNAGPTTIESHYGENHVHVAAIDNGLAFPFKHPDSWRSYPYGWLFLPRPLIAQPFTKATRDHFLPLLSSPVWWRETIADLRRLFSIDSDFDQGMFNKQMAVMKGQGWNIVETLKNQEHGPIDLCRRVAVVVWDEEVTVQGGNTIPLPGQMNIQNQGQQALHQQQQSQGYVTTQPRSMTMDAAKASYSNYGSIMTVSDRLSGIKALPTSPSAIGEGTPFFKKGSLPHMAIPIDEVANSSSYNQLKHDSFREVVSDGEYDVHDEDEDEDEEEGEDEDGFSYDEEYDDFEYELDMDAEEVNNSTAGDNQDASQLSLPAACRDGMVSIDMTLADPTTAMQRNQQRFQSHQSEGGRGRSRRQRRRSSSAVMRVHRGRENGALVADSTLDEVDTQTTKKNHRRSQTEHDDKKGTIRFEAAASPERSPVQASKVTSLSMTGDTFHSHENNHIVDIPPNPAVEEDEPERGRSRGFFARGYGAISSFKDQHSLNQALSSSTSPDSNHGGGRPKWSDRLRRGLSFDGHLLAVGGIGQAAKRERKLRKQRQREREQCVVLVERIEPAKNLPFFEWW
ncbi:phosphatidyl inositol kinase [Haplosporangium sp. Z 767]|nr:phosphatidyl inositol kinase [Haplosporangium sp. Z 11]KAF9187286.1 phosphatidyl inositol kinase [Haplosporangium sp. Z 767]